MIVKVVHRHGRDAAEQARHYADVLYEHREEAYPFFQDLARVTAAVWSGPEAMRNVVLDGGHGPRCEVWWPEGRRRA